MRAVGVMNTDIKERKGCRDLLKVVYTMARSLRYGKQ